MPRKFIFGNKAIVATNRAGKAVDIAPAMNLAGGTINIMIFGEISEWWGVNSRDVYWALKDQRVSQINVFISSPGGEITEAFTMHDMLKGHPAKVTAYLVGLCASAATIVSCAADEVIMSNQCLYMIHRPQWGTWGESDELRTIADVLDKFENVIVATYKRKTGMSDSALHDLMEAETWFEPTEALALGFVDKVVDAIEVDFLLPTTGTQQPDTVETAFNYTSSYRVAALAALEKGLRPANSADIRKFTRKSTNTMFGKDFFKSILNFLSENKALAKDADVEELAQDLADDEELVGELQNDAITEAVKAEVAKVKPTALTMETLVALVDKASDEDKSKIAAALNIKPAESKKPGAKKAEGEETEDEPGEEDEDEYAALNQRFTDLQAEFAALKKGGSATAPTNGKPPLKPKTESAGNSGKPSDGQLKIANDSFAKGYITAEQYEKVTGLKPPSRKKG